MDLPPDIKQLEDVSTSEAFRVCACSQTPACAGFELLLQHLSLHHLSQLLDKMVDELEIPVERADAAKSKFAKLHASLVAAMSREKQLLSEARMLKRKLDVGAVGCRAACLHDACACCTWQACW